MNKVKAGDICMIVGSVCDNNGKIVVAKKKIGTRKFEIVGLHAAWEIDPPILAIWSDGARRFQNHVPEKNLRPIREPGEDATDEMVALLGKPASQPSKEHA